MSRPEVAVVPVTVPLHEQADAHAIAARHFGEVEHVDGDAVVIVVPAKHGDALVLEIGARGWTLATPRFEPAECCDACSGETGREPGQEIRECRPCGREALCVDCEPSHDACGAPRHTLDRSLVAEVA